MGFFPRFLPGRPNEAGRWCRSPCADAGRTLHVSEIAWTIRCEAIDSHHWDWWPAVKSC